MFGLNTRFGLNTSVLWLCYGVYIFTMADLSWRAEFRRDGWYRIYEEDQTDYDGRGGHNTFSIIKSVDGPYTKYEIDKLYSNELRDNKIFMNSYGTIYNLPYWFYNKNSQPYFIIGILIHIFFLLSVPVILYLIGINNKE